MKNFKFASHNSFTYLPVKWYMRLFNFMSRCQSVDAITQFSKYGVRIFDLRVSFDKNGVAHVRHGFMDYGEVPYEVLYMLDALSSDLKEPIYVRVLLEKNKWNCNERQETLFITYCAHLEGTYSNLFFSEGRRKYDWKQLFAFKHSTPIMSADFSSVVGGKLNDLWPWLYAKKNNKKAIEKCDKDYLMLDFVEIR